MTRYDNLYSSFVREYAYPRRLRTFKTAPYPDALVFHEGRKLIDFSSSDYLGLAKHPFLIATSHDFAKRFGTGSGSSRLVRGNLAIMEQIENRLAKALGKESALILGSGYQTNASTLEALLDSKVLGQEPLVFCDRACHSSIYAGLTGVKKRQRFNHNDLDHLEALLKKTAASPQPKFIIAESLYSMDGDQTDLSRLIALAKEYQAAIYLDDAHAIGVYGQDGFGKAVEHAKDLDLIMGTFSKGLGSYGSYLACSQSFKNYLTHRCKGLIYSTALAPPVLGAISAALDLLPSLESERERIKAYAERLRAFLDQEGLPYGRANTHIVPWIIGEAPQARRVSQWLEEEGILAIAIQPPSVPVGQSLIRFCFSALHSEDDLQALFSAIRKVKQSAS